MENKYLEDYYPHSNGYSDRALDAMDNNSYPMNHWTKETLLDTIGDVYGDDIVRKINEKKVNFETLKNIFLNYDGWHHTGSYYNETSFYQFNVDLKKEDIIKELDEFVPTKRVYVKKEKSPRMYVTALVRFTYWTGTRNHPQKWEKQAIVNYMSDNKKIHVDGETKIFSKLTVVDKLESKYKYLLPKKNWVTYNKRV